MIGKIQVEETFPSCVEVGKTIEGMYRISFIDLEIDLDKETLENILKQIKDIEEDEK